MTSFFDQVYRYSLFISVLCMKIQGRPRPLFPDADAHEYWLLLENYINERKSERFYAEFARMR